MTDRQYARDRSSQQSFQSGQRQFQARRRAGWGLNLYRNTREGKLGGVAAGLADHWDIAAWVVRLRFSAKALSMGNAAPNQPMMLGRGA